MKSLSDAIHPFQIDAFGLRGRLVRLGASYAQMLDGHAYPNSAGGLMGETAALAGVLAGALKYDGMFTLQIQGDGPLSLAVVQLTSKGDMRGYMRVDADGLQAADAAKGDSVPRYFGAGHLAFTVEQPGRKERYQGVTELADGTLSDCAHTYFQKSEQLETAIMLAADPVNTDGAMPGAAALMLQRLPPAERSAEGTQSWESEEEMDEQWRHAVVLMSSLKREELLDPNLSAADILYRLYHAEGVRLYDAKPVRHQCRCSRERVAKTLKSFDRAEVADLVVDGAVTVTCEFCKTDHVFDEGELSSL